MKRDTKVMGWVVLTLLMLMLSLGHAQVARVTGNVHDENGPLEGANVSIPQLKAGTTTTKDGTFLLTDLKFGTYTLTVSFIGYRSIFKSITIENGMSLDLHFDLQADALQLGQVVVSGTRSEVLRSNSPVIINTISSKTFEATQSLTIAEGLHFSPGLRIENNCQNCGFTQLRMNGLDGPYSQILINSRPVFSALAGVYGLEMLPANMVDRIEVVRGGGSVMYGGNAIAGTVNIITKDPIANSFEAGINQAVVNGETPDRTINFNGSVVSDKLDKGVTFFGFNRERQPWDANGDGFSEMVKLKNNTFGFDAFWEIDMRNKLKLGAYHITEFRRGGNQFDLFPHQTDLTEQLQHNILSTNVSYEHYSANFKHKVAVYGSVQTVNRESYYGGGGRVLAFGDTLTQEDVFAINAYGTSRDAAVIGGVQYNYDINDNWRIIAGSEYVFNDVVDEMAGYGRAIDQQVGTLGHYAQLEVKPIRKLTFLLGGRFDYLHIRGQYNLVEERFENNRDLQVFVPRLSAMYALKENLKLRASFAQGYRGPQAFDEDLHIETVGGAARFIRLDPSLAMEKSNSALLSLSYDKMMGRKQMNLVIEGFYTELRNPFILSGQVALPNGIAVITKRNGEGAAVGGINLEANIAIGQKWLLQSGATVQTARYAVAEEIWTPEDPSEATPAAITSRILRTPDAYGYFSLVYNPTSTFSISYSGVVTGSMVVPHVIDPETEKTVLKSTPSFFDNNIKLAQTFETSDNFRLQIFGGVQNIFNSFQRDFDLGATRDAGYVYGPMRPRTFFLGLKFGLR